jgi:hypothetical protein
MWRPSSFGFSEPGYGCREGVVERGDIERSSAEQDGTSAQAEPAAAGGWYLLLVIPMIGTLIPPIYNYKDPVLIGIPFFYWYLLLWVPISVACTAAFYRTTRRTR